MRSTIGEKNNVLSYSIELSGKLMLTWVSINYLSALRPSICQFGRIFNETIMYEVQQ